VIAVRPRSVRGWGREARALSLGRQGGFSLLELMIAIIILGLGLIMVATMYPVAWTRARDLSEYRVQVSSTEAADTTLSLLARANRGEPYDVSPQPGSFAGDFILYYDRLNPPTAPLSISQVAAIPDRRVHYLYVENITASAPRAFVPNRKKPWSGDYAPWRLEQVAPPAVDPTLENLCDDSDKPNYCDNLFYSDQVLFGDRVMPPLPPRGNVDEEGTFADADPPWDEALDLRRFAWGVFHRLLEPDFPPPPAPTATNAELIAYSQKLIELSTKKRVFEMYYVTLRRPLPTLRYARQDPEPTNVPNPDDRELLVTPEALPKVDDVLLPEPWRVQVYFPADLATTLDPAKCPSPPDDLVPPTGIPTVLEVNTANAQTAAFLVEFFDRGAMFIDEQSGKVYRVVKRRLAGNDLDEAYLTLDREVMIEDIDDGLMLPNSCVIEHEEQIRTVWVFPPAVEAIRVRDGVPVFTGKPPVVGIETRTLEFPPS